MMLDDLKSKKAGFPEQKKGGGGGCAIFVVGIIVGIFFWPAGVLLGVAGIIVYFVNSNNSIPEHEVAETDRQIDVLKEKIIWMKETGTEFVDEIPELAPPEVSVPAEQEGISIKTLLIVLGAVAIFIILLMLITNSF